MSTPKISIVTVVFNGERYLEETILSVHSQSYKNIEYIIVDGNSTDGTKSIIDRHMDKIDKYISEPDRGLSDAMNKGTLLATGDWVLHLHADDTFVDNSSVERLIKPVINSAYNWVTGYLKFTDENGVVFKEDKFYKKSWFGMLLRNIIRHQATLIRRECMSALPFDEHYKYAMDYDFFLRLWKTYGPPLNIKDHIVKFRLDGNNLSSDYFRSLNDEAEVRKTFRFNNKQNYLRIFDKLIYKIRYYKIVLIHSKK